MVYSFLFPPAGGRCEHSCVAINTGSAVGKDIGVLDIVALDDRAGGVLAAEAMVAAATAGVTLQNELFVNDETGNGGMAYKW